MFDLSWDPHAVERIVNALKALGVAAALGAALAVARPQRHASSPGAAHIAQAQILLALVGAIIVVVVAESLARAFAVVGAAGLIRYRSRIKDPKDAAIMLVALTLGLAAGAGLFLFAAVACAFVIAVLWVLESFEPSARRHFALTIHSQDTPALQPEIEQALQQKGVTFELRGSTHDELRYEVSVPYEDQVKKLTRTIRELGGRHGTGVEWEIKKYETVSP